MSLKLAKNIQIESLKDENAHLFESLFKKETELLEDWFLENAFTEHPLEIGFEIEFFLADKNYNPLPKNLELIDAVNDKHLVPESNCIHLELNTDHFELKTGVFEECYEHFNQIWQQCHKSASSKESHLVLIGSIPTASKESYQLNYLTPRERYFLLDSNLKSLRGGKKIHLDLLGEHPLQVQTECVAICGLISSFQIHFRIGFSNSVRYYNAAQIATAPMVALSANTPYILQQRLWEESRIPFFEQLLTVKSPHHTKENCFCFFGTHYLQDSFFELFEENYRYFPRLLPIIHDEPATEKMNHTRLQNSVVYRWNRPVLDFDPNGEPHLRIELRSMPSGPTLVDMVANALMFTGLTHFYGNLALPPEKQLSFTYAKRNFYEAANKGLNAKLYWLNNRQGDARSLIIDELIPSAQKGLTQMGFDPYEISYYLNIIKERATTMQTGSQWQRQFIEKYGPDFHAMLAKYLILQQSGTPVHEWQVY